MSDSKIVQCSCFDDETEIENETRIDIRFVQKVAVELSQAFNLTFFGFDVIVSQRDGSYFMIDITDTPDYRLWDPDKVKQYFWEYLEKIVLQNRDKSKFD